jgi:hypothetical protein
MGAWGYGTLQNDTAQDGISEVARRIEEDIASLAAFPANPAATNRWSLTPRFLSLRIQVCYHRRCWRARG